MNKISKIDKSNMKKVILDFPKQFKIGLDAAKHIPISTIQYPISNIIVCGMGGSAWPAELLRDWLNLSFPFYVNKTYVLPPQTNKKSLVIISSYSGNTEETLSCYEEAKKRGLNIVGLTTDGKLKELCQKDKKSLVLIPKDVPAPRLGCGYTFASLAKILSNVGLIEDKSKEIMAMAKNLKPAQKENDGKKLAKKIAKKIPIVYTTDRLKVLAYIWKIKFNETGKIPAFSNHFPELNHNELNGYLKTNKNLLVIILKDNEEHPKIIERMEITARLIGSKNISVTTISLAGKSLLEKIFNSVLLADWASYYLAIFRGIDPIPVEMVEGLKRKMIRMF